MWTIDNGLGDMAGDGTQTLCSLGIGASILALMWEAIADRVKPCEAFGWFLAALGRAMSTTADIRLTEERLRNHLNGNQASQELMCLALLPILGPYTRERPRRPYGGPDGGRDIEALHAGQTVVWAAVGFRMGGGSDNPARTWAANKFRDDLANAKKENPQLAGFAFFTNVDLTPGGKDELIKHAKGSGIIHAEIFDFNVIRNTLDRPEGLLVRLQYLGIPMSADEQAALISRFGQQLQNAVVARFDRVEQTLAKLERFLDLQKPIFRIDVYTQMNSPATTSQLAGEALLVKIAGLGDLDKEVYLLLQFNPEHRFAHNKLVCNPTFWIGEMLGKRLSAVSSVSPILSVIIAYYQLSLTTGGTRAALGHATQVQIQAQATSKLAERLVTLMVDVNGYEIANYSLNLLRQPAGPVAWANDIPEEVRKKQWVTILEPRTRDLLFDPPERTPRYSPLQQIQ